MLGFGLFVAFTAALALVALARVVTDGTVVLQKSKVISLGGVVFNENAAFNGNQELAKQYTLPLQQAPGTLLPQPGTVTVSSGTAGSILMSNEACGMAVGQRVDVYWEDVYGNLSILYGASVSTVTVGANLLTTIAITGGTAGGSGYAPGSSLPAVGYQVTVAASTSFPFSFSGVPIAILVQALATSGNPAENVPCFVSFQNAGQDLYSILVQAGDIAEWMQGEEPQLSSISCTEIFISHASQTVPQTIAVGVLTE